MELTTKYLALLYPGTLILFIILFIIWYGYKINQKKSIGIRIFLVLGLILYLVSFYKNYGLQYFLIFWIIRDAIIFLLIYVLTKFIIKNKVLVTVVVVIACGIIAYWYYKNGRLPFTKPQVTAFETTKSAQLLIDVKDKDRLGEISKLLEPYQSRIQLAFPGISDTANTELDDYYTVDLIKFTDTLKIFEKLINSGLVDDVEYNETYTLSPIEMPNANFAEILKTEDYSLNQVDDSTLINIQKPVDSLNIQNEKPLEYAGISLNDPRIAALWAFNYMEIDKLMVLLGDATPIKKAKIFILDTGVDATHEDLIDNYFTLTSDYDFDTDRHGTHCAGIACAVSNNNLGIASLNLTGQFTTITSITVLPGGSGRQENIIDGIILAADNGADVISMSLGGASTDSRQRAYEKAIKYANDKGAIVVVAAGNENRNAKNTVPASCKGVITVSAVDDKLQRAVFSNDVSEIEYKLSAPGVQILSTTPGNDYQFLSGTSMATPYVSGLIGIMKAFQPKLTTEDVYKILSTSGIETKDTQMTGKFIQPLAALSTMDIKGTQSVVLKYVNKFLTFKPEQE